MSTVYNSEVEISLRVLLILDSAKKAISSETITTLDFLSVYGKEFGIYEFNLNGDSPFMYSQMSVRHDAISKALQNLSLRELIELVPSRTQGYIYKINDAGKEFCQSLESVYATEFSKCTKCAYDYLRQRGIKEIQKEINQKVQNRLRRNIDD